MFFAFFTLVLIALPVGMLFLPVMSFPDYPEVSVTGLDIVKYGIIFIFENAGLEIPAGIDVSEGIVQFITMIESNDALLQMENVLHADFVSAHLAAETAAVGRSADGGAIGNVAGCGNVYGNPEQSRPREESAADRTGLFGARVCRSAEGNTGGSAGAAVYTG